MNRNHAALALLTALTLGAPGTALATLTPPVPEPASGLLFAVGSLIVGAAISRKSRRP